MKYIVAATVLAVAGASVGLIASDRVGVYGVVDKVIFEPSAEAPERIQLWGAFAVATRNNNDYYDAVRRGYLYFTVGSSRELTPAEGKRLTHAEWNDLQSLAGARRIVAFSSRFGQSVRVRAENEKPQTPDRYVMGLGVQTIQPDRDYAPIKALAAYINRLASRSSGTPLAFVWNPSEGW